MSKTTLSQEIASVLQTDDLQPEERTLLERWLADPRADDIWSKIETKMIRTYGTLFAQGIRRFFIREIIAAVHIADEPPDAKALLEQAANAESLANFLSGPNSAPRPPILDNHQALITSLFSLSSTLREAAARQRTSGIRQVSRMDRKGSRKRGTFIWWISQTLESTCGQPFDEAAAFFTELQYPDEETDADRIRNTRRPRTRAGRTKPC